jgi:hypothetical protein
MKLGGPVVHWKPAFPPNSVSLILAFSPFKWIMLVKIRLKAFDGYYLIIGIKVEHLIP